MDLFEKNPLLLEDLEDFEEKPLISFKCKKSFLLVVIYWIFELIFRLVSYLHWDTFQMTEKDSDNENFQNSGQNKKEEKDSSLYTIVIIYRLSITIIKTFIINIFY